MAPNRRIYEPSDDYDASHGTLEAVAREPPCASTRKVLCVFGVIPFLFYREGLLPIVLIPFLEAFGYRLYTKNLPQWLREMPKMRETISATSYVASISVLLGGINALYAIFQRKITWGVWRYEILSATKCPGFRSRKTETEFLICGHPGLRSGLQTSATKVICDNCMALLSFKTHLRFFFLM